MLEGKTVLITGANRGIGKALVYEFARNGANVIAHARTESDEFIQMLADVSSRYDVSVWPVFFDMTDTGAMKSAVRGLISSKVPVNILINNAGVAHAGMFQMTSMDRIREIFNINLFAHMELTQLLLRYMIRGGTGSIVNMASVSGMDMLRGSCAYGVSKAALIAFTKTLAAECGANGIRVNAISPGLTDTDMASFMEEKAGNHTVESNAMNRRAQPEEIAKATVFLASDDASFINGHVIRVDGGGVEHNTRRKI